VTANCRDQTLTLRRGLTAFALADVFVVSRGRSPESVFDVIYLLTAVGLSPGGSTHLYTNNT
jgi:hypothetical protein